MTNITSGRFSERRQHCPRGVLKMTIKNGIAVACGIGIVYMVWIGLPFSSTAAQDSQTPVPALVAGPVRIKKTIRSASNDVVDPGQRAVLMATNISDVPIDVRMEIRAADDFSKILASTRRTVQPGMWVILILPFIEQDDLYQNVIGVVLPASFGGENWSANSWNAGFRGVLASLSVEDESTNATNFVVATNILLIRSSVIGGQR